MKNTKLTCLVCEDTPLQPTPLEAELKSHQCAKCLGRWVHGPDYLSWLQSKWAQAASTAHQVDELPGLVDTGHDSEAGKLCLFCGRYMRRLRVGHGVTFHLDRCMSCGGFWFDGKEWETLRSKGLHRELHLVFTDAWQAEVRRQAKAEADGQRLEGHLGAEGLTRADSIAQWIVGHPHGKEILARIIDETQSS